MKVAVIAIGDELLIGQVTDTNSGEIARRITPLGWSLSSTRVVHDNEASIITAIDRAFDEADIVITTGGLGPTKDDITKHTLCRYFGGELVHDPATYENVKRIFASRGLTMNELTAMQALVPSTCHVIQNQVGTAPITWWQRNDKKVLVSMPGVPFETTHMLDAAVIPMLKSMFPTTETIEHRTTVVAGISESQLAIDIAQFEDSLPKYLHLAYLPKDSIVRLRLDGVHPDAKFLNDEINRYQSQLVGLLGRQVIATEDLTPEEILLKKLKNLGLTIGTAESCTGGNIAHVITSCPGASEVYKGSVVSYANSVKISLLGVDSKDIATHGAVSREVVEQMAVGAKKILDTDIAIATSGIAGPGGGTLEKPVGTVWMAVATPAGVVSILHHLTGSRERIITQATVRAITLAIQNL
ncbi:MAG: CinA family nicotinamide mononucleotide deamidase-related protein [Muribaculum sp.]|nr:CinA family nicotinamide mononucleotide deamidase-related protein [Muribaculum sp.]